MTVISLINLWCSKNLVDSQFLLGKLFSEDKNQQLEYSIDPYDPAVEYVFLNTCGFISSGRQEMFHEIQKLLKKKKKIWLLWCAVQYFSSPLFNGEDLNEEGKKITEEESLQRKELISNPNISLFSWQDLLTCTSETLKQHFQSSQFNEFSRPQSPRFLTNAEKGYEYLKIAEWCNNHCSFCLIPKIRGKQKSLPQETILEEVQNLINQGVKEIIFIAQDSTRYGTDLYGHSALFSLFEEVEKIEGDFRYRVLYLYPDLLTLDHLKKLTTFKKFIPYFDLPFQHISSPLLKSMKRFYDEKMIYQFLDFIKEKFQPCFIRTNFIIGFPGETEEDVDKLIAFIEKGYFDNIALFEYHDEPFADSSKLPHKIPYEELHQRFLRVQKTVQTLLQKKKKERKNQIQKGVIQEIREDRAWNYQIEVRPLLHCPEIDEVDIISPEKILSAQEETLDIGGEITYKRF